MYNYIKKTLIGIFIINILFINVNSIFAARDIMDVMFQPAKSYEKIIDLGNTKNAVGNEVFRESTQIETIQGGCVVNGQIIDDSILESQKNEAGYQGSNEDFCSNILGGTNGADFDWSDFDFDGSNFSSETQAPLIVRITKFLLRLTIILSITMILYNGILWVIESAKGGDVKDAKDNIIYVIGGILLALSSVALINIISSITLSSINLSQGPSCNINGTIINKGDELKAFVCEEAFAGKWYADRIGNRCRVDYQNYGFDGGHWAAITDTEQVSKCIELGGTFNE